AVTSVLAAGAASAQPLITVDENGNGNFNGMPLPSGMAADPYSGITTLAYRLPFPGVPGDVQLAEPNAAGGPSDPLRFDGNRNLRITPFANLHDLVNEW